MKIKDMKLLNKTISAALFLAYSSLSGQATTAATTAEAAAATTNQTGSSQEYLQGPAAVVVQPGYLTQQTSTLVPAQDVQPGYQTQTGAVVPPSYQTQTGGYTQPGYQYQGGTVVQPVYGNPDYPAVNPYGYNYSYGQSSVQYAQPVLPIKPYVPYSQLSPLNNAYPLAPYTTPQENQVNQTFMQRYSQQDQDYIRSQYGYPHTFVDPNAGKPPLGKPILYNQGPTAAQIKANASAKGKGTRKSKPFNPKPIMKRAEKPTYFFPGMVAYSRRMWVGSDYLYYLPTDIGVVIELIADKQIKSDEGRVILDENTLQKGVETIFSKAGINPQAFNVENTAPLPFFHILILMYHVENKVFASISGRLFEDVKPERLDLDSPVGTFQAITWEKNDILIVSTLQAPEQMELMVNNIAQLFVNRVQFYQEEEFDMVSPDDLRD